MKIQSKSLIAYCAALMAIASPFAQSAPRLNNQIDVYGIHWAGVAEIHAKASKSNTTPVVIPTYSRENDKTVTRQHFNFHSLEGINDHELLKLCNVGYVADIGFAQSPESSHSQIHCFVDNHSAPLTISFRLPTNSHLSERVILTQHRFDAEHRNYRSKVVIEAKKDSERVVAISAPSESDAIRVEQSMTKNDFVNHLNGTVAALTQALEQSLDESKETRNFHVSNLRTWAKS
ncbi:hypothetical protein OTK49_03505 [Vibrio coralliirubri]|uniref:hypothetical protein n=1 Tax=Vibrio coralliirubri TaxID=1516159 RepID=UPI002283A647|nr:hypothetical protein [Vibrio coralliirubri]MCY9861584.1 hypothetical protein [Vibrio coralliirubri]